MGWQGSRGLGLLLGFLLHSRWLLQANSAAMEVIGNPATTTPPPTAAVGTRPSTAQSPAMPGTTSAAHASAKPAGITGTATAAETAMFLTLLVPNSPAETQQTVGTTIIVETLTPGHAGGGPTQASVSLLDISPATTSTTASNTPLEETVGISGQAAPTTNAAGSTPMADMSTAAFSTLAPEETWSAVGSFSTAEPSRGVPMTTELADSRAATHATVMRHPVETEMTVVGIVPADAAKATPVSATPPNAIATSVTPMEMGTAAETTMPASLPTTPSATMTRGGQAVAVQTFTTVFFSSIPTEPSTAETTGTAVAKQALAAASDPSFPVITITEWETTVVVAASSETVTPASITTAPGTTMAQPVPTAGSTGTDPAAPAHSTTDPAILAPSETPDLLDTVTADTATGAATITSHHSPSTAAEATATAAEASPAARTTLAPSETTLVGGTVADERLTTPSLISVPAEIPSAATETRSPAPFTLTPTGTNNSVVTTPATETTRRGTLAMENTTRPTTDPTPGAMTSTAYPFSTAAVSRSTAAETNTTTQDTPSAALTTPKVQSISNATPALLDTSSAAETTRATPDVTPPRGTTKTVTLTTESQHVPTPDDTTPMATLTSAGETIAAAPTTTAHLETTAGRETLTTASVVAMPNTTTSQGYVPTATETDPSVLVTLTPPTLSNTAVQTTAPTSVTTSPTDTASTVGSSTETLVTSTTANTTTAVSTTAATEVPRTVRATTLSAGNMTATFPAGPSTPATQNFSTAPTTGSAANPNSTALPSVSGVPTEGQTTALPPCHPPAAKPTDARLFLSLGLTTHLNLSEPHVRGMVLSKEEEMKLFKLENERVQMEKLQKQKEHRDMLISSARAKMKRLNQEKQEELALDMKILERFSHESQEDTEGKNQRKQELFKEQQMYREYLAQQLEEETHREKEMDKLLEEEMEKSWTKKVEQMRLEKEARKRLMKDVLDTRRLQIEEKLERNAKQQEELAQDKKLLAEAIKELNSIEEKKYLRQMQEAKAYREQLQAQITYQQQAHIAEEEEKQREYESGLAAERVYQEKMKDILSRPYMKLAEIHPLRRKLMSNLQV